MQALLQQLHNCLCGSSWSQDEKRAHHKSKKNEQCQHANIEQRRSPVRLVRFADTLHTYTHTHTHKHTIRHLTVFILFTDTFIHNHFQIYVRNGIKTEPSFGSLCDKTFRSCCFRSCIYSMYSRRKKNLVLPTLLVSIESI